MSAGPRYPLSAVRPLAHELAMLLEPACKRIEVAGSIRRLRPEVGDVELVAIPKVERIEEPIPGDLFGGTRPAEFNLLWRALDGFLEGEGRQGYILKGPKHRAFTWPLRVEDREVGSVRVDLYTAAPLGWGWIYLVRTGSAYFSKFMAGRLKAKSFKADEGQIYHRVGDDAYGDPIGTPEEADVFRLAEVKPLPPAERSWA